MCSFGSILFQETSNWMEESPWTRSSINYWKPYRDRTGVAS